MIPYKPIYFTSEEFYRCVPSCLISDMDEQLLRKLDRLRKLVDAPLILSSAYRSVEYEKEKGRRGTSSHTLGKAVDILCSDSSLRYRIIRYALLLGFNRIGIADSFIHLDISPLVNHSKNIIWTY